ncbi:tryptophan-rich sensory protein [Escherichia coli]|uniref:tryptophan-rich sensory protein n=1 Tax=Escherichia coli TaxID=562 RepID=UPI00339D59B1
MLFARIRTFAAVLLIPYLAWIAFAGVLLYQIHELNPNAGSLVSSRPADEIRIK